MQAHPLRIREFFEADLGSVVTITILGAAAATMILPLLPLFAALWIFAEHDRLVSCAYAETVRHRLPDAEVEVWDDCGHVPQIEFPAPLVPREHSVAVDAHPERRGQHG